MRSNKLKKYCHKNKKNVIAKTRKKKFNNYAINL